MKKSGNYIVRFWIPDPEFRKIETNFFLKCIVANICPVMNFCLKWFLLYDAFMNWAQYLGLYYDQRLRVIAPNFSSKRLIGHPYCGIFEGSARALFSICPKMQRAIVHREK